MRSYLFVPGDSEKKLAKAVETGADALILDLEDSVAPEAKARAREIVRDFLATRRDQASPRLYVRVNALDTGLTDDDLDAIVPGHPAGIVLPKAENGASVGLLDASLTAAEVMAGIESGHSRILPITAETGASLFGMGSYAKASSRLAGLTWGAEDLSADIGATTNRDATGALTDVYRLARALCLAGAAAAEVDAVETVFADFRNDEAFRADCEAAVRDGFSGRLAIHPAQVAVINEVFTPADAAVAEAKAVVAAFGESQGVASLNGQMLDRPHLTRARRLLSRAEAAGIA